jgi:methyl-accepting chemotaxis protein
MRILISLKKNVGFKKRIGAKVKRQRQFKPHLPVKKYKGMTIYKKLSISFVIIAVVSSVITGGIGMISLNNSNVMSQNIYKDDLVPLAPLYRIQTDFITMGTKINGSDVFSNRTAVSTLSSQLLKELSQYSSTVKNTEEKAILSQMAANIGDYVSGINEALNDFGSGDSESAYKLIDGKISTISANFDKLITGLYTQKIAEAKQRNEESQHNFMVSMGMMAVITLVSIGLAAFMGRLNAKQICKPISSLVKSAEEISRGNLNVEIEKGNGDEISVLADTFQKMTAAWSGYINEISSVLSQMSEGNLDVTISSEYKGDFRKIKESLNQIITTFNEVIGEIIIAANEITSGTSQLSAGSHSLSSGAAEQAASVEELTASIAEIAQKTKQNAISASEANKIANSVKEYTASGNDKMRQMLGSMSEISESAMGISDIIKAINDIALQTNVLALNASIEAARAGSYGKGFAVVAEEVRHLALRSTDAAKDTTQMIDKSIDKAAVGTNIAQGTSDSLKMIAKGVNDTAAIIEKIAISSKAQAMGISQINKGIEDVSKIVQTNSATAEQGAAASEELFNQAKNMKKLVSGFKVREK